MKEEWVKLNRKIEALSRRERLFVMAAAVAVPVYLVYAIFIDSALTRRRVLHASTDKERAEIAVLERELQAAKQGEGAPEARYRARQNELKKQIRDIEETLKAMHKTLVPANRVNPLLQQMLTSTSGLQLVSLRTLPVSPVLEKAEQPVASSGAVQPQKPEMAEQGVYKHGVEVTVRGSYGALHSYLQRLESSPQRLFWWRAQLAAAEHPTLTMTFTIYTLSLDKAWLEL